MKKIIICIFVALFSLLALAGCSTAPKVNKTIEIKEMREIAELATVECYFHNVAKSDKKLDPAWYEFWAKKEMRFWVEYEGVVTIGIDVSKLKVEVNENKVKIALPEAVVLDAYVEESSLKEESFYFDPNAEKPTPEEQTEAFRQAQNEMKETAEKNRTIMANAQDNAKELLENYVNTIGEAMGVEYTIEWEYVKDQSDVEEIAPPTDSN